VHAGRIVIEGRASERLMFFHADGTPYGGAVSPVVVDLKTKAFQALRGMGFKETEVKRALDSIDPHVGTLTLESLVRQGLSVMA
jgi:Holliday junction resolvasome RuvABC DNA-binding subunit